MRFLARFPALRSQIPATGFGNRYLCIIFKHTFARINSHSRFLLKFTTVATCPTKEKDDLPASICFILFTK